MDRKTRFLDYIINIKENDLSRKILVPLFSSMYKCRIEFSGGTQEKGKDLIIFNKDEFGFNETIGVQVKKTKPTANSTGGSIQQIITQLQQMRNEKVIDIDTAQLIPIDKLIFATPYVIPENVINHAQGAFIKIKEEKAHIIDGEIIYKKLLQHIPSIIDSALGDNNSIWENILSKISNEAVTKSLNSKNKKKISDIYCEISFNLNHKKTNRYLEQKITKKVSYITIADNDKNQADIDKNNEKIIKLTGKRFYEVTPTSGLKDITSKLEEDLEIDKRNVEDLENELSKILSLEDSSIFKSKTSNDISQILSELKEEAKETKRIEKQVEMIKKQIQIGSKISQIQIQIINIKSAIYQTSRNLEERKVNITVNVDEFCQFTKSLKSKVGRINDFSLSDKLKLSRDLSIAFSFIESHESLFHFEPLDKDELIKVQAHISCLKKPLSTPIVDILDNGSDVLICGEAGSGKTTNLQAYTLKLYKRSLEQEENKKFIFYSTLNDIFSVISSKNLNCISEAIFYIAIASTHSISLEDFRDKLKNEESTLILDSIDECISTHKDTLELISAYKEIYPRSQIITSSRHTIEKTLSLGFSCISILPFTREQKVLFFKNWLEDDIAAQNIIDHLDKNKHLELIIDNPLNATILAVLYENKVKLPSSESSLYQRRFELISGKLDQFKGIQRTNNTSDDLVAAASFIAFEMHKLKIRKITEEQAHKFLLSFPFEIESRKSLFSELVMPCEIILKNEDDTYEFGHLKFQEYLASKDLDNRRSMNFSKILSSISWWEETLFLYAQHARDISWIVNYVCMNSSVKKHYHTLSKLVELWRGADKIQLTKQIEAALRTGSDYDD